MSPHTVSVVISPPTVDLDSYEPFDEEYIRTVGEILSDEPSFDASFDAYNSGISMDGANDSPQRGRGTTGASVGRRTGHTQKKSPYFSTGQMSQRRVGSKRDITRIDVDDEDIEDEDEEEDEHEDDLTPATSVESVKIQGTDSFLKIEHNNNRYAKVKGNDTIDDDVAEEAFVFASVQPEAQARLLDFIASHPFMRDGSYPVRRSKRRTFVCELYEQAKSAGMDERSIDRLTNYVRKTYLELYGDHSADTQGSEFGDEIDDVAESRRSSKVCKKDRKRKRSNGDSVKDKSKKRRSKTFEEKDTLSMADSHNDTKHEVIDLEAESPLEDTFAGAAAEPKVLESVSPTEALPKDRRSSVIKQSDRSPKDNTWSGCSFVTPDKRNDRTSVLTTSKNSLISPANSQDEPICLESDSDGPKQSARAAPVAHSANPNPSDKPETGKENIARPRKERNGKKRRNRRKRRAEKYRGSLRDSEIQELAANDRHIEEDATTKNSEQNRRKRRVEKYRESLRNSEVQELAVDDRHIEEDATTKNSGQKNGGDIKDEKDVIILDDPFWTLDFWKPMIRKA